MCWDSYCERARCSVTPVISHTQSGCSFFLMLEREKCRQSLQSCCLNEWKNSKNKPKIYLKPFLCPGECIFVFPTCPCLGDVVNITKRDLVSSEIVFYFMQEMFCCIILLISCKWRAKVADLCCFMLKTVDSCLNDTQAAVQRPLTVFQRAILASPHLRLNKLEKTDFYCYLRATRVLFSNVYALYFVVMVGH